MYVNIDLMCVLKFPFSTHSISYVYSCRYCRVIILLLSSFYYMVRENHLCVGTYSTCSGANHSSNSLATLHQLQH